MNLRSDTLVAKNHAGDDVFIPTLYWRSAHSFLDDWDKPLDDLRTEDVSRHGDEIKHRLQTGLRAIVREFAVMCDLPSEAYGEPLLARLDAILGKASKGTLPSAFYTPVFLLREWLTRPAGELRAIEQRPGMSDPEWDAYVKRIGSGE